MKNSMMKSLLALAALAITLSAMGTARAQYVVTGTTAGGGNVVVGSGLLGTTYSGDGFLTENGSDHLTITLGSFATGNNPIYGAVVDVLTNNNTFINYGTITASGSSIESPDPVVGTAVSFDAFESGTLSNETVINHGNIFGAAQEDDEVVGAGVSFISDVAVQNISIINTGLIEGASGAVDAGTAGSAVSIISDEGGVNGVTLFNSGNLFGGEDGDALANGNAVTIVGENGVSNISITNTQGANIIGGNESFNNDAGEELDTSGGNAIYILDENGDEGPNISNVSISNAGNILGGNDNFESTVVGNGIAMVGFGPVTGITVNNSSTGVIQGGNGNGIADEDVQLFSGVAIGIAAVGGEDFDSETLSNVGITNYGLIQGGHDNDDAAEEGTGIALGAESDVSNLTIFNGRGGSIMGGDDNDDAFEEGPLGSAGNGINIDAFEGNVTGVTITNWGNIIGGNDNDNAELSGNGIGIEGDEVSGIKILNGYGATIAGGNDNEIGQEGFDFTDAGAGIYVVGDVINGLTIANWGVIRGGNDEFFNEGDGGFPFGGDAIDIQADDISNVKIFNGFTGVIQGGLGGGYGIDIYGFEDPANVEILNFGVIEGGAGDFISNNGGGNGIEFVAPDDDTNIHIKNFGWILGGNGVDGGDGGAGIGISGNNTTIHNWGVIAGGANSDETLVQPSIVTDGAPAEPESLLGLADAIDISGNGNTLNLDGHSSVIGKINIEGGSNVVNLNFTGVPLATLVSLNAQLQSQGVNSGSNTNSVIFTLRGVTYDIDPAIVNGHLTSYQGQAGTQSTGAVGASLDSATVNPSPGTPLFNLYNAIDQSGNVPEALQQLSPQVFQLYSDIALANANFTSLEIDHRLNNLRDGSESVDTTGIGGDNTAALTSGMSKDDGDGKGGKEIIPEASKENKWGFFASGNAIFTNISARDGLQGSGFTSEGTMMGLDGRVNEHWVVGSFFDYEHTDADLDSHGSKADVDSYGGGLYTGYHDGPWYGNGLVAYTYNDYTSNRSIVLPFFAETANGSTSSNQFELNLDGGYDININNHLTWGPILGLQYVHLDVNGFSESGAPAADLAVGSQDMDSFRSRMGLRIEYHKLISKKMAFATELRAEWQHEFLNNSEGIGGNFIGDGLTPFTVQTTSPERDAALVGLGANLTVRDKYTFFFDYDVQAGQQDYLEQSVKGGLKISW